MLPLLLAGGDDELRGRVAQAHALVPVVQGHGGDEPSTTTRIDHHLILSIQHIGRQERREDRRTVHSRAGFKVLGDGNPFVYLLRIRGVNTCADTSFTVPHIPCNDALWRIVNFLRRWACTSLHSALTTEYIAEFLS